MVLLMIDLYFSATGNLQEQTWAKEIFLLDHYWLLNPYPILWEYLKMCVFANLLPDNQYVMWHFINVLQLFLECCFFPTMISHSHLDSCVCANIVVNIQPLGQQVPWVYSRADMTVVVSPPWPTFILNYRNGSDACYTLYCTFQDNQRIYSFS